MDDYKVRITSSKVHDQADANIPNDYQTEILRQQSFVGIICANAVWYGAFIGYPRLLHLQPNQQAVRNLIPIINSHYSRVLAPISVDWYS